MRHIDRKAGERKVFKSDTAYEDYLQEMKRAGGGG